MSFTGGAADSSNLEAAEREIWNEAIKVWRQFLVSSLEGR